MRLAQRFALSRRIEAAEDAIREAASKRMMELLYQEEDTGDDAMRVGVHRAMQRMASFTRGHPIWARLAAEGLDFVDLFLIELAKDVPDVAARIATGIGRKVRLLSPSITIPTKE